MPSPDNQEVSDRSRADVLNRVAEAVPRSTADQPIRVAVDGVDGAGKSIFGDELAALLAFAGRPVIRASVDSFHRPRAARYRRGRTSPSGFWLDSFNYEQLRRDLLDPLSPGGSRRYRTASHDLATDQPVNTPWTTAAPGSVIVLDGLFLHREELRGYWDFSIFLDVPFVETARRMATRDATNPDPDHPTMARYVQGQRLYFAACEPADRASMVIDNTNWDRPTITSGPPAGQ